MIETVNESRATRVAHRTVVRGLLDVYEDDEGNTLEAGWKNKLIWQLAGLLGFFDPR